MAIKVALNHKTLYQFDRKVSLSPHIIRLRPAPHTRTPITAYSLKVNPTAHFINWQQDPFGNYISKVVFNEKTDLLQVEVDLIAQLPAINPLDFIIDESTYHFPFQYEPLLKEELGPYFKTIATTPLFAKWLHSTAPQPMTTINFLSTLNNQVKERIKYELRLEPGIQTPEETLTKNTGSCRDMSYLLIQTLRHHGLAARFVSGYLVQLKSSGYLAQQQKELPHDFIDLHAWVEVYLPGAGWVGLDPTSGYFASEGHIPLCCTPNPSSAAPITGSLEICETTFSFDMSIRRLDALQPLTHADPYSKETWAAIDQLADIVDLQLEKSGVHLTMGGEPTFISTHRQESPQWNHQALGQEKYLLGLKFIRRLRESHTPGGLLMQTQGKWYANEELPRWSLGCYWLKDGPALWQDITLLAAAYHTHTFNITVAEKFIYQLAHQLEVDSSYIMPAYEDEEWQHLVASGEIKTEIVQHKSALGFVLPLSCKAGQNPFQSYKWGLKRYALFLTPGTSALGYRLPLKSVQKHLPADAAAADFHKTPPTALCVEIRNGMLCVFIPPITDNAAYRRLLCSLEKVASDMQVPIFLEGYPPPQTPDLLHYHVTPDPGVLEVNIAPASNWQELKACMQSIYEEAKEIELTAERFLIDGRRTSAGGGHHILIGGKTPQESPIFRRPDLLQSIVTFWQHHPSLSYFFSGMYVGPTSQAPRVDEARHEGLYELEIAFAELQKLQNPAPEVIASLFRHILVDITGNAHRSEICLDKLYDAHTPYGQQGLLEFRAFEMQPHPHMALLQMLLVRALVAYLWQNPYQHELIRWGTKLHDRMLLPYFLWKDLGLVLRMLRKGGFEFKEEWFAHFYENRFPRYGSVQLEDITLDIRQALEPWHVFGLESSGSTASRTVDSSTERVQVIVKGLNLKRYLVTCNKRPLPLHPTSTKGEYIAGLRFKAWSPPTTLHPSLKPQAPLTFDLYDTLLERSLGGCIYHTSHPGGINQPHLPIHARDAQARCVSRFEATGHTPCHLKPSKEAPNNEYPYTLDLRRLP